MINFKIIYKILGSLLFLEAIMMLACLGVALYYGEEDTFAFLVSVLVTVLSGIILGYKGRNADNIMSRRDSYLIVTLTWTVFSLFGTIPFMVGGYLHSFTDAYFETMSGFTTTGATIIDNVEILPHGILFWRSLTHWIGGLGIVFFTIAVLPQVVGGSTKVFAAEATGPIKSKLSPRLSTSAKWIWLVYLFITFGCMAGFMLFGMNWFEGINYAMSTAATGGYSIYNDSIEHFHSPGMEYTATFFCFISGVNFTLFYCAVAKKKVRALWRDTEFRLYLILTALFTAFIMMELVVRNHYGLEHAFRSSLFSVVSFMTTTGLFNDDAGKWPHVTWVVLAVCMLVGGCSGSTAGGMKCVRITMLFKVLRNELRQRLHPHAVLPLKISGVNITYPQRVSLLAFFTAYLLLIFISAFIMIASGIDNTNAITIAMSCIGNVGPTLGLEIGPTMSWSMLPDFAKWICTVMMLFGRLEIFSVIVCLTPSFWTEN